MYAIATALAVVVAFASTPGAKSEVKQMIVIAHRAGHESAPENTMPAVQAAIDAGADLVELDIRTTADGQLVVMHDSGVDRTTDGTGKVRDLTLEQIRSLDAGSWYDSSFAGTKIATADEGVAALSEAGLGCYADAKDVAPEELLALLRRHNLVKQSPVYGSPAELAELRRLDPDAAIQPEFPGSREAVAALVDTLKPDVIAISRYERITPENVAMCRELGVQVWVDIMAHDDPEGWQHALDCGVDGIQTDRPSALVTWLRERGLHR